jgi:hypothetical protein
MWRRFSDVLTAMLSPAAAEALAAACPPSQPAATSQPASAHADGKAVGHAGGGSGADGPIRPDLAIQLDAPHRQAASTLQPSAAPSEPAEAEAEAELDLGCEPAVSAVFGCESMQVGPAAFGP